MSQAAVEELITEITVMERPGLIERLRSADTGFRPDFDEEFLDQLSMDELRHLVLAASLQAMRRAACRTAS